MAVRTSITPRDHNVKLIFDELMPAAVVSEIFATAAVVIIEEAKRTNRKVLGYAPPYKVSLVRGSTPQIGSSDAGSNALALRGGNDIAVLNSLRIGDTIITEFELVNGVLTWIGEQLVLHSPVKSGRYARSHTLFADGQVVDVGSVVPVASQYIFLNIQPYARKIETGASSQAPDGVFQAVAALAKRRFGNQAKIEFNYRSLTSVAGGSGAGTRRRAQGGSKRAMFGGIASDRRTPAIVVTLRGL